MRKLCVFTLALLFTTVGCAVGGAREAANTTKPSAVTPTEVLRPYLGKWSPMSFAEQMNIGSVTITTTGLSFATEEAMTFTLGRREARGVVLEVTGSEPPEAFSPYPAIGLTLEWPADEGPRIGEQRTEEILWIYWCDRSDKLSGDVDAWQCSHNRYRRLPEG